MGVMSCNLPLQHALTTPQRLILLAFQQNVVSVVSVVRAFLYRYYIHVCVYVRIYIIINLLYIYLLQHLQQVLEPLKNKGVWRCNTNKNSYNTLTTCS